MFIIRAKIQIMAGGKKGTFTQIELWFLQTYLQCIAVLGGVYGGVGLVRFLALPWVGTPGLVEHTLGECPPGRALCLLLHQGAERQVWGKNVCLCTGVADIPEQKKNKQKNPHTVTSHLQTEK